MVRWAAVCRPKSLGGLGIIDTKIMNICLMVKWIWKILSQEKGLWIDILRAKYLQHKDILVDNHGPGSQFWNAL
jgi:hypothetical protein